jgi:hypothetical protein
MMLDNYRLADQASQSLVHGNHYDENQKIQIVQSVLMKP